MELIIMLLCDDSWLHPQLEIFKKVLNYIEQFEYTVGQMIFS